MNAATTSEDEDSVQGATPRRPSAKKPRTSTQILGKVMDIQEAVMERMQVLEGKVDSLVDLVRELKAPDNGQADDADEPADIDMGQYFLTNVKHPCI